MKRQCMGPGCHWKDAEVAFGEGLMSTAPKQKEPLMEEPSTCPPAEQNVVAVRPSSMGSTSTTSVSSVSLSLVSSVSCAVSDGDLVSSVSGCSVLGSSVHPRSNVNIVINMVRPNWWVHLYSIVYVFSSQ